jgi:hypothetical protein
LAIDLSYAKDGEWLAHAEKAVLLISAIGEFSWRANERATSIAAATATA